MIHVKINDVLKYGEDGEFMPLEIKLNHFEGPLDLLLHLIRELEVDIYDIPISEVTHQYMMHLRQMKELELDVAGEYLVMASTLMAIKSHWLIPRIEPEAEAEDEFYEDPREDLTQRLLEYQLYKDASEELRKQEEDRKLFLTREAADLSDLQHDVPLAEGQVSLTDLLRAIVRIERHEKRRQPTFASIEAEEMSIDEKMDDIINKLRLYPHQMTAFSSLLEKANRSDVVTSLLAILELMKEQRITAFQESSDAEILIRYREGEALDDDTKTGN